VEGGRKRLVKEGREGKDRAYRKNDESNTVAREKVRRVREPSGTAVGVVFVVEDRNKA
jgi:hypothetical protein